MKLRKITVLVSLFVFTSPLFANSQCLKDLNSRADDGTLYLSNCQLQDKDMPTVSTYLAKHPDIYELRLSDNTDLTAKGYEALANNKTLSSLSVSQNTITDDILIAIAKNKSYKVLDFEETYPTITNTGFAALGSLPKLEILDLCKNNLRDKDVTLLANALLNTKSLFYLDIATNSITSNGAKALASLNQLFELNLSNNIIRDEGAIELANTTITFLNLEANIIGDKGAIAFTKNWKPSGAIIDGETGTWSELNLGRNNITDEGAYAFVNNQIPVNVSLAIYDNVLSQDAKNALAKTPNIRVNFGGEDNFKKSASKLSAFKKLHNKHHK